MQRNKIMSSNQVVEEKIKKAAVEEMSYSFLISKLFSLQKEMMPDQPTHCLPTPNEEMLLTPCLSTYNFDKNNIDHKITVVVSTHPILTAGKRPFEKTDNEDYLTPVQVEELRRSISKSP